MKRGLTILYIIAALCFLSGCSSNLYSNHRDMERLRPIQTFGLDGAENGVVVSVSSGAGPEQTPPLVMKAMADGIEDAITRLQDYSPKDELFYAHVEYILIGESISASGVDQLLDWVERSPSMRLDTAAFLVKGSASDAVTGSAGESTDITERLASLEREQLARGQHIYTLRQIAASMADRGYALCLAVQAYPAQGTVYTEEDGEKISLIPVGYGVLQEGKLASYLDQNESLGVQFLTEGAAGAQITVNDTVLEFFEGDIKTDGQWDDDGKLTGIQVTGTVRAGIVEQTEPEQQDIQVLEAALTDQVQQYIYSVITHAQTMGCDFLDLGYDVLKNAPKKSASLEDDWADIFPAISVTVAVDGQIARSYDLAA
jgi:spore germination protein KC